MPRDAADLALLEREAELAQLDELIAVAADGAGGALAVVGPPGIGKTSLLAVARRRAREHGLACVTARGGELERDFPYGIVRQLFERPLRDLPATARDAVLDGAAAAAVGAFGLPGDGADSTFAAVHGLYWTCVNLSARRPLLLVVDDLHWADAASLRFLAYLVRRIDELPIALLVGARPAVADAPLLEAVLGADEVRPLRPAPLTRAAVGALAAARFGPSAGAAAAHACWEATAGNPFLCEALLSALEERGIAPQTADIADVAAGAVSTVVVSRLGRLPEDAAALARAVAVLGTNAELRHAAAFAGLTLRAAGRAADALAGQDILAVGRPLEFVHPLVRAAVADRIPAAQRLLGHAQAARVLHAAGAPPDAVAAHLLAAEPAADAWAVERLRLAARDASARGAPEAAVRFLRRALEEAVPQPARADVLHELGVAELHAACPSSAVAHLHEAHALAAEREQRLRILPDLVTVSTTTGGYAAAVAIIEPTLEEGGLDADLDLRLRALLLQFATLEPRLYDRVRPWLEDLHPGRTPEARRTYLAALTTRAALRLEPAAQVREWARQAYEDGLTEDVTAGAVAWNNVINPLIFAEGFDLAERMTDDAVELARRRSSAVGAARAYGARAMLALRRGDLREAIANARAGVDAGRQGGFYTSMLVLSTLVRALVEHGDLAAAQLELERDGMAADIPDSFLHNWVLESRGWLRLAEGRVEHAAADFAETHRRLDARLQRNPGLSAHRSGLALARLRLGDRDGAIAMAAEELARAEEWGAPSAIGRSRRTLGLATGGESGLALLRSSVHVLAGSGARLQHAHSLVELGAALRRHGERAAAREPLRAGMELAFACTAEPLVEHAREDLLACGARPRRIMRTGVDALTPSELRVARMAAGGLSNREIAQALFVTLRTVQVHLTHSYQKLNVASRAELGAALADHAVSTSPSSPREEMPNF